MQDDELDAILGELTVLESQFDQEIVADKRRSLENEKQQQQQKPSLGLGAAASACSPAESDRSSSNITDLGIHSNSHSRSSSGSDEAQMKAAVVAAAESGLRRAEGGRTESPDTDSAFCDNLSLLSSCSAASSNKTGQSVQLPTSVSPLSKEEQEAKIKAEKIKIAIEKIKEASVKKLFIKVFTSDGSAKSLLVDEKMSVGQVTRILAEKNHVSLDPKWALVELVPDLYMERVYEDHEQLVENCLLWKVDSKNTLWFIERPEKFDLFLRPEVYLLGTSSSQRDDQMEEHSRQELLEEYFSSSGVGAPELEGNIWLKADSKKSWKKFYFVLRTSGLYYAPKGKKTSKDLVCLTTFDMNQVYYGVGWKNKYKAPSEFCFGIKHPQIQAKNPKYIKYLCVDTQRELHQWVTGIRVAKNGKALFDNYRGIVEEITHADIDILTSKRFSVNSTNGLQMPAHHSHHHSSSGDSKLVDASGIQSPARTPSSENKSLASALSSGIESDLSIDSSGKQENVAVGRQSDTVDGGPEVVGGGEDEEAGDTLSGSERVSGLTPVGTLDRSFKLRRSFSRSSRSSSSSGCLSDKSGAAAELGFESDFPLGGTIKKRPAATPRLPLTSTTWGLVRESEGEDEVEGGGNMGLGAGGTLLRKAVRNSLSRKTPDIELRETETGRGADCGDTSSQSPAPVRQTEKPMTTAAGTGDKHDDPLSSAFERSLSSMSEEENLPLPPPPRMDSISSLVDDIDMLPPPPPDMCYSPTHTTLVNNTNSSNNNHYHVSPVTSPSVHSRSIVNGLPPPAPSIKLPPISGHKPSPPPAINSKKSSSVPHKSSRRISFDDNVQMIEAAPVHPPEPPRFSSPAAAASPAGTIHKFSPVPPIRNSPGRLTFAPDEEAAGATGSLPRSFLNDLQKVMNKKWKVAEKCRTSATATPHEVLGFRDEPIQQLGQPGLYSQNSAIGAWVLETQQYAAEEAAAAAADSDAVNNVVAYDQFSTAYTSYNNSQILPQYPASQPILGYPHHNSPGNNTTGYHQQQQQQPAYNNHQQQFNPHNQQQQHHYQLQQGYNHNNSNDAARNGGIYNQPPHHQYNNGYSHQFAAEDYGPAAAQYADVSQYSGGSSGGSDGQRNGPVVLVEPEPNYVDPSRMRANKGSKRPPPPPRRNENTQLTAGY